VHGLLPGHFPAPAESIYDANHAERMNERDDIFSGTGLRVRSLRYVPQFVWRTLPSALQTGRALPRRRTNGSIFWKFLT
jgi:hypothetical protein